jgi:uncharacterized protein YgbK (DUF1537 family)
MTLLAILADDLTGAADAGGPFASAGFHTVVALAAAPDPVADVLVRSTESRGMDAAGAAASSRSAALALRQSAAPPTRIYKTIDSMLRGSPGEEVWAMMDALVTRRALVAPALPAQGRTTVGSRQFVHGTPVWDASGDEGGHLLRLFSRGADLPARALDLATVRRGAEAVADAVSCLAAGFLVADAETGDDLAVIARAVLASDIRVVAGTAGLARQLARAIPAPGQRPPEPARPAGAALVVAASRHAATAAQVAAMAAAGIGVVRPTQEMLEGSQSPAAVIEALAGNLTGRGAAALTTVGLAPCARGSGFVVELLAAMIAELAARLPLCGLALTGGDVAAGVLASIGATAIELRGEIEPAIPWGILRSPVLPDARVVTKAGSFGAPDALLRAVAHLAG